MDPLLQLALEKQNPWWFSKDYDTGMPRLCFYPSLQRYFRTQEILLVLGARRTGKSTLLYQLIRSLDVARETILFINFDEPVFQSKADDPSFLSLLIEEYLVQRKNLARVYVFIDEVQNYKHWVQTIKTLNDANKSIKFVLTGSTSTLLKSAASTRLSGRYFTTTVFPLTFQEYMVFTHTTKPTILEKRNAFTMYLQFGGFPRVVLETDELLKQELLKNYYQTIYLKDIIYPHNVRSNKDVFDLLYFVLSTIGTPFSYTRIGKTLDVATDTVKEYLEYAEQSYLIYILAKYDPSVRKQLANPKKIYCLDTGLINAISFKFSENKGRLMENLVCITLLRQQKEVFYHKGAYECDFLVKEGRKITQAIQVSLSLQDDLVKRREVRGLLEAMNAHNLDEGIIITENEKGNFAEDGKRIHVIPVYEWLEL